MSKYTKAIAGFVGFATAVTMSFGTASAATTADLQAQITALLAQISSLQSQLGTTQTPVGTTAGYTFAKDLTLGSKGTDVTNLQTVLGVTPATGYFGAITKAALIKYQTAHAITPAAGYFGAKTRAIVNAGSTTTGGTTTTTGGTTIPTGTNVSVALSFDTPASGTIIAGQGLADLAHFTFSNPTSGPVNVTKVVLNRTGVSNDVTLPNVYLFDGVTRVSDPASVSTGVITFNSSAGIFTVPAGGMVTISVKSDIATATAGQVVGVSLASVVAGTATVSGSFPILGNNQSIATADITTANLTTTSPSPSNSTVNAGSMNQSLWLNTVSIGVHKATLKALTVKMIGSADKTALANVGLYIDGVNAGASTINANSQFVFDLSSAPVALSTGSHTLEVRGDVVGGAYRNFYMSLENATDLVILDTQVSGVSVTPKYLNATLTSVNGGTITVQQGTLTVTQDTSFNNVSTLVGGATAVQMAGYKFTAYGESVKINSLSFLPTFANGAATTWSVTPFSAAAWYTGAATSHQITVASTAGFYNNDTLTVDGSTGTITSIDSSTMMTVSITSATSTATHAVTNTTAVTTRSFANVGLYVNGGQVGSNTTAVSGTNVVFSNLGSNMTIPAGSSVTIAIKGDVTNSSYVAYNAGTLKFDLVTGSSNAQGVTSGQLVSTASASGQQLTIGTANVTFAQSTGWGVNTIAPNQAARKIGTFTMQTGSAEGVTVNNIVVGLSGGAFTANQITNLTVMNGSTVVGTPIGNPTGTNNFSVTLPVGISTTQTFDVYADIGTGAGTTVIPTMAITYRGATSNVTATSATITGATITVNTATVSSAALVPSSSLTAQFLIGGNSNIAIGTFNVLSNGIGGAVLKDMTVTVPANTVSSVTVNGITASVVGTTATLYNLGITVPADASGINIPMSVSLVCVNTSAGCSGVSGTSFTVAISTLTYNNGSTIANVATLTNAVTPSSHKLVGTKPTVALTGSTTSGLHNGTVQLGTFTVSADAAGDIKLAEIPVTIATSSTGALRVTALQLMDSTGNTLLAGPSSGVNGTSTLIDLNGNASFTMYTAPRTIAKGTSETYTVWGTVAGVSGATNTMSTAFGMGAKASLKWIDVLGGSSTPIAGDLLSTYPIVTQTINN